MKQLDNALIGNAIDRIGSILEPLTTQERKYVLNVFSLKARNRPPSLTNAVEMVLSNSSDPMTTGQIFNALQSLGAEIPSRRAFNNAVNGLAYRGRIRKVGYGKYVSITYRGVG